MEVSENELQRMIDATYLFIASTNFCARKPPSEAPNRCTFSNL